jgi:hypothetical protein
MLVPRKGTIDQPILDTITRDLRSLAGAAARVEFSIVEHITPGPTGKFRWVVSDLTVGPTPSDGASDKNAPAH